MTATRRSEPAGHGGRSPVAETGQERTLDIPASNAHNLKAVHAIA